LIILLFITFVIREKHGLIRNDFLDCMMELRKRGEDEAEEDMQSAENVKKGHNFRKLQPDVVISKSRLTFYCDCVVWSIFVSNSGEKPLAILPAYIYFWSTLYIYICI
jgi:hypothetical protein